MMKSETVQPIYAITFILVVGFGSGFVLDIPPEVFWPYFAGIVALVLGLFAIRGQIAAMRGPDKLVALGPLFFAAPLPAFAAEHFVFSRSMVNMVPSWIPAHLFWILFVGLALLAATISILFNRKTGLSGTLLGIMIFLFVILVHIPRVLANPHDRFAWAVVVRDSCFASAALVLAVSQTDGWRLNGSPKLISLAAFLMGSVLIFFSVEHFLHPEFVPGVPLNKLMPTWIPLRSLWGYATGIVLAAAGVSIVVGFRSRLAATGLGLVFLLLVIFIYLPIMLVIRTDTRSKIEGLNFFADTLMFGGAVLILAGALPRGWRHSPAPEQAPAIANDLS